MVRRLFSMVALVILALACLGCDPFDWSGEPETVNNITIINGFGTIMYQGGEEGTPSWVKIEVDAGRAYIIEEPE